MGDMIVIRKERKMGRRKKITYLFQIVLPLVLGAVFYLWIKPNAWCSNIFYNIFNLKKPTAFDENCIPFLGSFIKHQLCDILFAYSLTIAMVFVLRKEKHGLFLACGIAAMFETIFEVAQLCGFPGNFDPLDILAEVAITLAVLLCMVIYQKIKRRKQKT